MRYKRNICNDLRVCAAGMKFYVDSVLFLKRTCVEADTFTVFFFFFIIGRGLYIKKLYVIVTSNFRGFRLYT